MFEAKNIKLNKKKVQGHQNQTFYTIKKLRWDNLHINQNISRFR